MGTTLTGEVMVELRHDWTVAEILDRLGQPLNDLLFQAHRIHRAHFDANTLQISRLLSVKTGVCPEDCGYCPQSAHHAAGVQQERLIDLDAVLAAASQAKREGAERFCMGAAWRQPTDTQLERVIDMIRAVKAVGLEACVTLGMLTATQARRLKDNGLDYYNHNLDTSPEFYGNVITTRTYQERLETLGHVRAAGINVCSGGILGMGEDRRDRAGLLQQLANLPKHPESVPINMLIQVAGTPLYGTAPLDPLELVRTIATARIVMPASHIRLAAGRTALSDEGQAMCFFAGANSVFYGEKLLTAANPAQDTDQALFARLGLRTRTISAEKPAAAACQEQRLSA